MEEMESRKKKKNTSPTKIECLKIEKRKMPKEILQCLSHLLKRSFLIC